MRTTQRALCDRIAATNHARCKPRQQSHSGADQRGAQLHRKVTESRRDRECTDNRSATEMLDETNRNRYVTARGPDAIPGTPKVDIAERLVRDIDPSIQVEKIYDSLVCERAFDCVIQSDYVFGCIDSEGIRLILTELCAAYTRPYLDIASDI